MSAGLWCQRHQLQSVGRVSKWLMLLSTQQAACYHAQKGSTACMQVQLAQPHQCIVLETITCSVWLLPEQARSIVCRLPYNVRCLAHL